MNNENFKMRLSINGVEVEVSGDKTFVINKFSELEQKYINKTSNKQPIDITKGQTLLNASKLTLIDFIEQKKPKSKATELMPVLVYYFKHFEGYKQFNEDDIKTLYRRYDISKRPKNIYQAILDISRHKGYFESVPKEKGYFKITESGEHFVEVKLSKN